MSTVSTDRFVPFAPATTSQQIGMQGFRAALQEQRRVYSTLFRRCSYQPRTRALTIRTHRVRAFMAPENLGEAAVARLRGYLPIVTLVHRSGAGVWVLLTRPPEVGDDLLRLARRADSAPIVSVGPGADLALPTAGVSRRRWRGPAPSDATTVDDFPAYADVIEAITNHV